ncbi:hypothetical protein C8R44DRAFT_879748 [Mycena epipterygia]|nr:hypothetical protein C8R44DRAFT_879748 [Mycena epipterygia]
MSQLHRNDPNLIVIQDVAKKPPANPLLMSEIVNRTPAPSVKTTSSMNSSSQSVLANRILFNDQRCFLTGEVSTETQACHLINAIRTKQKPAKINLKAQVEFILSRQGFNGKRPFFLDSLVNFDVRWHGHLNKRGSFCVVVPRQQIHDMVLHLLTSNIEWDIRAERDPNAPRNLDTTVYPFVVNTCLILVLRPHLFLPDNKPILINMERTLRARGAIPPQASALASWVLHRLQPGSPFLVDDSGRPLHNLEFKSERTADDSLSIFSLLVNAHYKLQALPRGNDAQNPDEVIQYASTIRALVELIFHVPDLLNNPGPFPLGSQVPPLPNSDPTTGAPMPPSHQSGAPHESMDMDMDSSGPTTDRTGNVVDESGAESDLVDGDEFESEENVVDESGADSGLVDEAEFESESESESDSDSDSETSRRHTTLVQAFDTVLSEDERASAIMRGLGMASPMDEPISPLLAR